MTASQSETDAPITFITRETYALLDESGTNVVAVLIWSDDRQYVFALDEEVSSQVPRTVFTGFRDEIDDAEAWFHQMVAAGRIALFYDDIVPTHRGVLQVEDFRSGVGKHAYIIYTEPLQSSGPRLLPGVVYYEQVRTGAPRRDAAPRLGSYDEVLACAYSDDAVWIKDVEGLEGKGLDSPEAIAVFGDLKNALRVFDLYAMTQPPAGS